MRPERSIVIIKSVLLHYRGHRTPLKYLLVELGWSFLVEWREEHQILIRSFLCAGESQIHITTEIRRCRTFYQLHAPLASPIQGLGITSYFLAQSWKLWIDHDSAVWLQRDLLQWFLLIFPCVCLNFHCRFGLEQLANIWLGFSLIQKRIRWYKSGMFSVVSLRENVQEVSFPWTQYKSRSVPKQLSYSAFSEGRGHHSSWLLSSHIHVLLPDILASSYACNQGNLQG